MKVFVGQAAAHDGRVSPRPDSPTAPSAGSRKKRRGVAVVVVAFVVAIVVGVACAPLQRGLDRRGLAENASAMLMDPLLPPPPARLEYLLGDVLEVESTPEADATKLLLGPRNTWRIETVDDRVIYNDILTFPSSVRTEDHEVASATFFIYRQGELGERPAILWLPGVGFADYARPLFEGMYEDILRRGYDLVVWVPPYHLSRQRVGVAPGEGLLRVDCADNLRVENAMVQEIRTAVAFLESRGVKRIGGWGGSLGAAILWITSSIYNFDHINMIIPILDWRTFLSVPKEMEPVMARLHAVGYSSELLGRVVHKSSPVAYDTRVPAGRIQIQYAKWDQVTDEKTTLTFARDRGINRIVGYDRSHATMLLTPSLYDDYNRFLEAMTRPRPSPP